MRSNKMKDYLPDYYRDSRQMNIIMETAGQELDTLENNTQDVENQFAIQKATWKITTYEEIFAVTASVDDTLEQRRARLLSKLRLRSPTTRKEFLRFLEPFAETVEINQYFSEYLVEFIFTGMKAGFDTIYKALYVTMPAHLNWKLQCKRQYPGNMYYGTVQFIGKTTVIGPAGYNLNQVSMSIYL